MSDNNLIRLHEREDIHKRLDDITQALTVVIKEMANTSRLLVMLLKKEHNND